MDRRGRAADLFVSLSRLSLALVILTATVSFILQSKPSYMQASGSLDPDFGTDGKVISNTSGAFKLIRRIAIQRNGKIIVVGNSSGPGGQQAFVGRYNENGTLDTSFGVSGFSEVSFQLGSATAVALQPNKKILVGGTAGSDFGLARFNRDGTPDTTFGVGGVVTTDFFGGLDQAWGLARQQDGKIILAGSIRNGRAELFGLARYEIDGGLDEAFGASGRVGIDFSTTLSQAVAVALQPDGKIVASGLTTNEVSKNDFAIVRLNTDGRLDRTFGSKGKVTTDFSGGFDLAWALLIQPDSKIVAVGEGNSRFALARYDPSGRLDDTFGVGGKVTTDFFGIAASARSAILQSDGKIIAAGVASKTNGDGRGDDFALARYNADGTLDTSFGTSGKVTVDFFGYSDSGTSVALQRNGKIIIAGFAVSGIGKYSLAMAQLLGP